MSRSSSEYASAIVQLSDLIIERRQRILHHWDWIYWRTQQGKRFKQALSVVHKCVFLRKYLYYVGLVVQDDDRMMIAGLPRTWFRSAAL